jgi:hypothetical protein
MRIKSSRNLVLIILAKMRKACKILVGNPKRKMHMAVTGW